jgi:hypothetical protein
VGMLCFRALALFGDNISQVLGADYLILAVLLWAYEEGWKKRGLLTFGLFFLKIFVSGYEYMIPVVCLAYFPLVFYAVRDGYDFKRIRSEALAIATGIALATVAGTLILAAQIAAVDSFRGAVAHFGDRLLARTYFPTPNNRPYYFKYMNHTLLEVFLNYYRDTIIWIGPIRISYAWFVALCSFATLGMVRLNRKASDPKLVALAAATWFSLLGALLWIVIMKGHSATHWFIDPIVWQMPFAIFAVTFLSVVIGRVFTLSRLRARGGLWPTP